MLAAFNAIEDKLKAVVGRSMINTMAAETRGRQATMIANGQLMPTAKAGTDCWVISDGTAGNEGQALALARALKLVPRVISLQLRQPWDSLAPRLSLAARSAMRDRNAGLIAPPWPSIAIGCGRRAALLTRCLRAWSGRHCFTAQILDPRINPCHFDLVIAPRHDHLEGENVIQTLGGLNSVDEAWLADARNHFAQLSQLPMPRTAILIGASHDSLALDDDYFDALFARLQSLPGAKDGSFLVSTSRRTPVERINSLRQRFSDWPGIFWSGAEDGENPYPGILGWADRFIVTADSVNMVSEACATGKPVHAFAPLAPKGKLGRFRARLLETGYLSGLDELANPRLIPALREAASVADQIRQRWTPGWVN